MGKNKKVKNSYTTFGGGALYEKPQVLIPKLEITKLERDSRKNLMREIFSVQAESRNTNAMRKFIMNWINELSDSTIRMYDDKWGNVYVRRGSALTYPCIVSHIDTVHNIIPDKDYAVLDNDVHFFAIDKSARDNTGIGGDDKCGIYTCLDNLLIHTDIKIAFFVDEEIGCQGSQVADMAFFDDVSFVLQADRRGYSDVASDICYTEMFGIDFLAKIQDTLNNYHRHITDGGMTDVMQLAHNGLKVAMANFSCGYYEPHSKWEYVVIDELILTSILFRDIIRVAYIDGEVNEMDREDAYNTGYYDSKGNGNAWGSYIVSGDSDFTENLSHDGECSVCGCQTSFDYNWNLPYCNNCMDYDYNPYERFSDGTEDVLKTYDKNEEE